MKQNVYIFERIRKKPKAMIQKVRKNWIFKGYLGLPLWGKVAAPAVVLFLLVSVWKTLSWAFWLGILAVIAYAIASVVLYIKDKGKD